MEIIDPEKFLLKIVSILDELKIEYFITGGFAVSVWVRPRATFDIDVVIIIVEPKLNSLILALRNLSKAGYVDEGTAIEALKHKGEFNFIDPDTGLKVDFWIKDRSPRVKDQFKRRIVKTIDGQRVVFVSPEDLILNKLLWFKESRSTRHIEDIESIFKISGKKLDKKYLKKVAAELDVVPELNDLLK